MLKKEYKFISGILYCIFMSSVLAGCSVKGDEKTVEQIYKATEKQLYNLGESIDKIVPLPKNEKNVSIRYTVNSALLYRNPEEAGVAKEKITQVEYQKNLEKGIELTMEEVMNSPMIVVDMTITNVNEEDPSVSTFSLVERKEDDTITGIGLPCYYSQGEAVDDPKYFHFNLLPGQTTDMKIGWYIDPEDYAMETICLTDNLYGDEKLTRYVNLELTESREVK